MKISILAAALVASTAFSANAFAADGTITFNGEITATTCVINGGGSGAADFTVTLPTVSTSALSAAAQTAGAKPFDVVIGSTGTPCAASNVQLHFEPTGNVDTATGMLKNTSGTGYATNVQVSVLNDTAQKINLADGTNSQIVPVTGGIATLNYFGQYEAVGGAATAGDVETDVQYSVIYN